MAITFIGAATDTRTTATITHGPMTLPSFQADDIIVVAIVASITQDGFTVPSGWTLLTASSNIGFSMMLWRRMVGGDASTLTITGATNAVSAMVAACFRGVDTTTAWDVTGPHSETVGKNGRNTGGNFAMGDITTLTDNTMLVGFCGTAGPQTTSYTWTNSPTEFADVNVTSGPCMAGFYKAGPATAGATNAFEAIRSGETSTERGNHFLGALKEGAPTTVPYKGIQVTRPAIMRAANW